MSVKNIILIAMSVTLVSGQRPSFAGSRPIGFPEIIKPTTEALENRFGDDDVSTTTMRLPLEANGDRELVERLSKLPIDQQPFWLINWQALEEHRKNPQTYPQRPNVFVDSASVNQQQPASGQQQSMGQQSMGQQPMGQQSMGQQSMGQQPMGQQSMGQQSAGQKQSMGQQQSVGKQQSSRKQQLSGVQSLQQQPTQRQSVNLQSRFSDLSDLQQNIYPWTGVNQHQRHVEDFEPSASGSHVHFHRSRPEYNWYYNV